MGDLAQLDQNSNTRPLARPVLWLTVLGLIIFFTWASHARLEEAATGIGKIAPSSRAVVIQNLEGGILQSIGVEEGEIVERGQTIARIDETRFRASYRDLLSQSIAVRASLARLRAEIEGASHIEFGAAVLGDREKIRIENALFEARGQRLREADASLARRIDLARQQLKLVRPLVKRKAMSAIEGIRLERELSDLEGERSEMTNAFMQDAAAEMAKLNAKLDSISQQMLQQADALKRTSLVSPVRGVVKNLRITTQGGVVGAGETIMEIVPLDEQLLVEARIDPKDVAFLRIGQPASIKITAYDYTVYGAIDGELVHISPDTLVDEDRADRAPYYLVKVKTVGALPEAMGKGNPIKPGMVASVHIQTGTRTVMDYLLKPLTRGSNALQER